MPIMSGDDLSYHTNDCPDVDDGMRLTDLPEEITSLEDLECTCWEQYDSLAEV
ncbi:hypothetical protein [Halopiger goleimassiliensis]|uniref:hypothetical protein n=1 Tax=Halopiger goleimassiliensis TaxID=1293048 RepID=UPI0018A833E1|nr:hypothetical protein [Halopiger goleimassiliensis]